MLGEAAPAPPAEEAEVEEEIAAEQQEQEVVDKSKKPADSWGVKSFAQAVAYQLVFIWRGNVVLKGSAAQKPCVKVSTDAATMRNAPRAQRVVTTVMAQVQSAGGWCAQAPRSRCRRPG